MLKIIVSVALLIALTACNDRSGQSQTTADSTTKTVQTNTATDAVRCFEQVAGRDTTRVRLAISGSRVTGELAVLPYEKDKARGPITGTLTANQIRADWQRSGEGVTQFYEVVFTMAGDSLTWREGERVEKQGKWVLANPDAGFTYALPKSDCR